MKHLTNNHTSYIHTISYYKAIKQTELNLWITKVESCQDIVSGRESTYKYMYQVIPFLFKRKRSNVSSIKYTKFINNDYSSVQMYKVLTVLKTTVIVEFS